MTLLNLSKYKSVSSGSNIKLPKALDHPKKGLINIQNVNDNECFKWCLVWYLHPADHHSTKLRRAEKYFAREFDFKNIKFAIKIADTHKNKNNKKRRIVSATLFLVMKTKKDILVMCPKILSKDFLIYCWLEKKAIGTTFLFPRMSL